MTQKHVEAIQWMLNLSQEDKDFYTDKRIWLVMQGLRDLGYSVAKINETLLGIWRLFVSADLSADRPEYDLYVKLTGSHLTTQQFFDLTNRGREEQFLKSTLDWLHSLSNELYSNIFTLGGYILTSDGPLSKDEVKLVELIEEYKPD